MSYQKRYNSIIVLTVLICTAASLMVAAPVYGETLYDTAKRLQAEEQKKKEKGEPDEKGKEEKKPDTIQAQKTKYRVTIFDFESFSDNRDYDYLSPVITFDMIKNLRRTNRLEVLSTGGSDDYERYAMGDYAKYKSALNSIKSVAALYSADFIVAGYYLIRGETITIVADLYIAKKDTLKNFIVTKEQFKDSIDKAVKELSTQIEAEIFKNLLDDEAAVAKKEEKKKEDEKSERFKGKKVNFGISLSYGYVSSQPGWNDSAFVSTETRIMTLQFFWNLSHVKSVRKIVFLRDLSLFAEMDMYQGFLHKDIFDSNEPAGSFRFHSYGILIGLMYRLEFYKYFSFNIDTGLGFARSQTSTDMSEEFRFIGYLVPPETENESYDFYYGLSTSFNFFIIKYVFFTINISFKYILYTPEPLYLFTYQGGIGFRF